MMDGIFYLSTKHFNAENVQCLSADILCTHVYHAFQAELSTDGRSRNTVLASTCFCNDACLPDPLG
jgi:hypothetical protein